MTGAMYAAIAGLKTHMQNLNVIGNNVANVNTYGYKASRAVFKTSLYTTLSGGSNGTAVMGGINPSQIGYGTQVSSVDVDMSTGNYAVTGKSTDLMLDGDGFFLVGSKEIATTFDGSERDQSRLTALTLTRVGNFEFRADGYLSKEDGNCVYGFLCTGVVSPEEAKADPTKKAGDPIFSDQLVPIRYPRLREAYYTEVGEEVTGDDIYVDPTAKPPVIKPELTRGKAIAYPTTSTPVLGADNQPTVGADGNPVTTPTVLRDAGYDPQLEESPWPQALFTNIAFDPNTGLITGISRDTEEVITIGCIAVGTVTNPNGVTSMGDNYFKASDGSGQLTISILGGNAKEMGIQYVNKELWELNNQPADGAQGGADNAEPYPGFDALYAYSSGSHIISNGLEMSKTDLAQEIANMILTQRGYQANTRIVTVTDSMLEELVNMKR